ncbi:SGNH/GDSL hydrolase family protein [Aurantiacibacter odishensis]|uniref:SGNH/GDSL hydrolase family protein n=1 Tax=Aurantiacibacter odishensis TaxID=1155476 RepID=UPI001F0C1681|nr:SGNH/GDSL hydrolase family protein [Aurantiacibacter odishensis]
MHEPLRPLGEFPVVLDAAQQIIAVGDSNTRGSLSGGPQAAYPAILGKLVGMSPVRNASTGGETVSGTLSRPWIEARSGDLVIVMFGTNDAAPRAWLSDKTAVDPQRYADDLASLAEHYLARGAEVLILAPLPAGSRAMDERIAPYREKAREAAQRSGARFLDPVTAFEGETNVPLTYDGIHLTNSGQRQLALLLSEHLSIVDR